MSLAIIIVRKEEWITVEAVNSAFIWWVLRSEGLIGVN
jgi:hypothetical protein